MQEFGLFSRETDSDGLAIDFASPLIVKTVETRKSGRAGAAKFAQGIKRFRRVPRREVADATDGELELTVVPLQISRLLAPRKAEGTQQR